jgi:hypothetical protein
VNAPDLVNRWTPAVRAALAPLPVRLPSMLRQQRLCRIRLRGITRDIARRYADEAAAGAGRFN